MGLIIVAAWVATFAIGGVLQAVNYFLASGETTGAMALGGVALAAIGTLTFYSLVKKRAWALSSFILLGVVSIAQFYIVIMMPMAEPTNAEWFRLIAASVMYTLVALFVKRKLRTPPADGELQG